MTTKLLWLCSLTLATVAQAAPIRHNYDLKNVLWKLTVDPTNHSIQGDATNTVTLAEDSSTVQFHCANLAVTEVDVDDAPAKFDNADDLLTVTLPAPAHAGQTLNIRAVYSAHPQRGFYFVDPEHAFPSKTGMVYTQGEGEDNRDWLPTYDLPDDKATTECFVTVPKTWTAVSNGKFEGATIKGDRKVFHWKMDQPFSTYLISLVAGPYAEGKSQWHGIPVSFFVPPGLESEGQMSFGDTPKMIDLYSRLTGVDYPYAKFSQEVVGDFVVGGMENITAVTQMIRTLHEQDTEPLNDSTGLVAHELAHQWFGDLVTCRTWEHMWLNEGFATTMPLFLDREWHGQDWFDLDRYSNFEGAINSIGSRNRKDIDGEAGSVPQVSMGSPYNGGASRILMLMHRLGEPLFWKSINAYLNKYKFDNATTDDFFASMSQTSGQDLSDFKRQWYHTAATPSLKVSVQGTDLEVAQLAPYYTLDLPVWIKAKHGWLKKSIHVEGKTSNLDLGTEANEPLLVDPECWTLMELSYDDHQTPDAIADLYKNAPNAAERARIVAELFPRLTVPQRIALARWEKVPGLVSMIAEELGTKGQDYLVELTKNPNIRVADSAVRALGAFPQNPASVARLRQLADGNPNEALEEHATRSLLQQTDDPSLASRAWGSPSFDDGFQSMAMEWFTKHDPDTARKRALFLLNVPSDEPLRLAAIHALQVVREDGSGHDVYDALIKIATENSYFSRRAAIQALGALGNKDAIPVLLSFSPYSPGGILGTAKGAIAQLEKSQ